MSNKAAVNLEVIVWRFIRNEYENKFNRVNVPMPLKYLIVSFSKHIIGSKLLTSKEDMVFVQLLLNKISNIKRFNLLFCALDNEFKVKAFHNKCDNKNGATVTIIQSNFGNVFGGYTTVPWKSSGNLTEDKKSFLFLIRSSNTLQQKQCPLLFDINNESELGSRAVWHHSDMGPSFGCSDISIRDNCNIVGSSWLDSNYNHPSLDYNYKEFKGSLCGTNPRDETVKSKYPWYLFHVLEYEVYQIQH